MLNRMLKVWGDIKNGNKNLEAIKSDILFQTTGISSPGNDKVARSRGPLFLSMLNENQWSEEAPEKKAMESCTHNQYKNTFSMYPMIQWMQYFSKEQLPNVGNMESSSCNGLACSLTLGYPTLLSSNKIVDDPEALEQAGTQTEARRKT